MDYKIKQLGTDISCGFPKSGLSKVRIALENKKINFMLVDRKHSFEEDDKVEFEENKYQEVYGKAHKYMNAKMRLENIERYILNNVENKDVLNLIDKCEDYIDEKRKVYSGKLG